LTEKFSSKVVDVFPDTVDWLLFCADMMNIAVLLFIVLVILSVAAVNILALELPEIYGSFGEGTQLCFLNSGCLCTPKFCTKSRDSHKMIVKDLFCTSAASNQLSG